MSKEENQTTELSAAALEKIVAGVVAGLKEFAPRAYSTPPKLAKQLGIHPAKVMGWIARGELRAVNIADRAGGGRARWRISPDALDEFLRKRESTPPVKAARQSRPAVKQYKYI